MLRKLSVLVLAILCADHICAETIGRDQVDGLLAECQKQRQEKIAPLKAQAIDDCINKEHREAEYCKRFYRNYGERTTYGTRQGLFWTLPECRKALEAEKYFSRYPSAKEFDYEPRYE